MTTLRARPLASQVFPRIFPKLLSMISLRKNVSIQLRDEIHLLCMFLSLAFFGWLSALSEIRISDEIVIKLDESRITSEKIITTSEQYRPVARRGALLFFVMNNLYKVNTYYMFSLNAFIFFF